MTDLLDKRGLKPDAPEDIGISIGGVTSGVADVIAKALPDQITPDGVAAIAALLLTAYPLSLTQALKVFSSALGFAAHTNGFEGEFRMMIEVVPTGAEDGEKHVLH